MKPTTLIAVTPRNGFPDRAGRLRGSRPGTSPLPRRPTPRAPRPLRAKTPLEAKHALFDETNVRTSNTSPTGAAFLAGLEAAGFAADTLEVTTDVTSVGLKAPSIQFAALVDSTCLIGQYGPDGTGYRSITAAPIATGRCLIGAPGGPSA